MVPGVLSRSKLSPTGMVPPARHPAIDDECGAAALHTGIWIESDGCVSPSVARVVGVAMRFPSGEKSAAKMLRSCPRSVATSCRVATLQSLTWSTTLASVRSSGENARLRTCCGCAVQVRVEPAGRCRSRTRPSIIPKASVTRSGEITGAMISKSRVNNTGEVEYGPTRGHLRRRPAPPPSSASARLNENCFSGDGNRRERHLAETGWEAGSWAERTSRSI